MIHPFEPVFDKNSLVLILGTFPSEKSREYFWKLIAFLTNTSKIPVSIDEKKELLLRNKIALWDVINSCDIKKSSDSSITNVVPNNLSKILELSSIKQIFANGEKAYSIYMRYCYKDIGKEIIKLPSTSPANASYSLERLKTEWKIINIT